MKKGQRAHNFIDKTGMRFGKLVCKEYLENGKWLCECDCGNIHVVNSKALSMNPKRRGIRSCGCSNKSKTCLNQDYFKDIDSAEKAYIIGFLAADGCIYMSRKSCCARIAVKYTDIDILEKIKKVMDMTSKISYSEEKVIFPQGGITTAKMSKLNIYGKELINDLIGYGLVPNKTLHLRIDYKKIPEEFLKDYLRGLWDGDGCFGIYKSKKNTSKTYVVGYIGSKELLNDIKDIIIKKFPLHKVNIWHAKGCNENIFRLGLSRRDDFVEFLNFIYKDATIYLDRKYKKYLDCMQQIKNTKYKKSPCRNLETQSTIPMEV